MLPVLKLVGETVEKKEDLTAESLTKVLNE